MRHVILYRKCNYPSEDDLEIEALQKDGFIYLKSRTQVQPGDLVIARFSCVPFYSELEADLNHLDARLINSYSQHKYIADLKEYVSDLQELTPETWDKFENVPDEGPYVLKGATNSKKFFWSTLMYAENKKRAIEIYGLLSRDSMIGDQEIYIRKYIPLKTYMIGLQGLPITEEYRFFIYKSAILCGAFYWSSHIEEIEEAGFHPNADEVPKEFLDEILKRVGSKTNFYVVDVARTATGEWICLELNDGQMSGLSMNDPNILYSRLKEVLNAS